MPLSKHDAEEQTRQIIGRMLDAREKVAETYHDALKSPEAAEVHMAAQGALINRQGEYIAALENQLRQALDNAAPPVITTGGWEN